MFFPLKLKNFLKKKYVLKNLIKEDINQYNQSLSLLRIGNIFKTTSINRYPKTSEFLLNLNKKFDYIYDIGCSDGIASLSLIENLKYNKYYCLDKFINMKIKVRNNNYYLTDKFNNIHMFENRFFVVYLDPFGKFKTFVEKVVNFIFSNFHKTLHEKGFMINLINPLIIQSNKNVKFVEHDLFKDNFNKKSDLIIIFNLLDKFINEKNKLDFVTKTTFDNLRPNGLLVVGENDSIERSTIYQKNNTINILHEINNGSKTKKYLFYE